MSMLLNTLYDFVRQNERDLSLNDVTGDLAMLACFSVDQMMATFQGDVFPGLRFFKQRDRHRSM